MARIPTPPPPSEGLEDFHLIIYDEAAETIERDFSAYIENNAGVGDEVTALVAPSGAGKTLTFTGRPDIIGCDGRKVVQFRFNDGLGWKDIFFGVVVEGWATTPMNEPKQYLADATELLNSRTTDTRVYPKQDPMAIALDLCARLAHPALTVTPDNFQRTNTRLEGGFNMPGVPLGQALEKLAESAEDAGRSFEYGVDGAGNIFFREPTGTVEVLYRPEDVEGFEPLMINMRGLVGAVYWVLGNRPSIEPYGGDYVPATLSYLSTPVEEAFRSVQTIIGRTFDGNPFIAKPAATATSNHFMLPENAWNSDANGDPILGSASYWDPFDLTVSYFSINSLGQSVEPRQHIDGLPIAGARIRYRCDYDNSPPRLYLWSNAYPADTYPGGTAKQFALVVTLPYSHETYTTVDVVAPPSLNILDESGTWYRPLPYFYAATFYPVEPSSGWIYISDFRFLCVNRPLLDAAARRELRIAAIEPASITPTRDFAGGLRGFYVPPRPLVHLNGHHTPDDTAIAAEFRYTFGVSQRGTVIDLGNPKRDDDAQRLFQIRLGVDRATEQSLIRSLGKVRSNGQQ